MRMLILVAMIVLTAGSPARSQDAVLLTDLKENFRDAAQSSGIAIAGVQIPPSGGAPRAPHRESGFPMALNVPAGWREPICVTMISADGLYDGEAVFPKSESGSGGDRQVLYPTTQPEVLSAFAPAELAVLSRLGACGRLPPGVGDTRARAHDLTVSYWRTAARLRGVDAPIEILVNSLQADRVSVAIDQADGSVARAPCGPAPARVPTNYNLRCVIERGLLGEPPAYLRLQSLIPGQTSRETWVRLHFSGG